MVALPLKHREAAQQSAAVVDEDRNILYSFLKDKLAVGSELAEVQQFAFPEFKARPRTLSDRAGGHAGLAGRDGGGAGADGPAV